MTIDTASPDVTATPAPAAVDSGARVGDLVFLADGDDVLVGRRDVDSYAAFPPDGAELLRRLADGWSPERAATWYVETYHQPVDLVDFMHTLDELGFLVHADEPPPAPLRWQRLGRWTFSPPAMLLYAAIIVTGVVAVVRDPQVGPSPQHIFVWRALTCDTLLMIGGAMPCVLLHEVFHALAGRRLGLRSRLRMDHRLYYVVFETSLDGLVSVPRRQRVLPIVAGVLCDAVVFGLLTAIAAGTVHRGGAAAVVGRISLALAFTTVMRICWQLYFFMRNDGYHLLAVLLRTDDLHGASKWLLRRTIRRAAGVMTGRRARPAGDPSTRWSRRDLLMARWYLPFLVTGYGVAIGASVFGGLPATWRFLSTIVERFAHPHTAGVPLLVDSAANVLINSTQFIVLGVIVTRRRRQRRLDSRGARA